LNNRLIILSGPSGAGKTTLAHHLLHNVDGLSFSISATTRPMRPNETNGTDYHFLRKDDFVDKIEEGEFLEYEEVYPGLYYGTLKSEIERLWDLGKTPLLDIDVMGALNIKQNYSQNALTIFLHPVSIANLRGRLAARKTENEKSFEARIGKAEKELVSADQFDYVVYNNKLEETIKTVEDIVRKYLSTSLNNSLNQ